MNTDQKNSQSPVPESGMTAQQINAGQVGTGISIPIVNKPVNLVNKDRAGRANKILQKGTKETKQRPPGWWSFSSQGSVDGVCGAIDARPEIPDFWKAALKADIRARAVGDLNFIYVDAHYHLEGGNGNLHFTCQAVKVL